MNALLFSLPGTPVVYYGDEIGMGDNIYLGDRNGVRTPMQWSPDRNAGFSRANPQQLILPPIVDPEYHYEAINVETQQKQPELAALVDEAHDRAPQAAPAFGRGTFEVLWPANRKILAFFRRYAGEVVLVVANLSRFSQAVRARPRASSRARPGGAVRARGVPADWRRAVPADAGTAHLLLVRARAPEGGSTVDRARGRTSRARGGKPWEELLRPRPRSGSPLDKVLADYLVGRRWFRGKARSSRARARSR